MMVVLDCGSRAYYIRLARLAYEEGRITLQELQEDVDALKHGKPVPGHFRRKP